jgi:hypothetical protein
MRKSIRTSAAPEGFRYAAGPLPREEEQELVEPL